jgi:hypothetical protein
MDGHGLASVFISVLKSCLTRILKLEYSKRILRIALLFLFCCFITAVWAQGNNIRQIDFKNFIYAWDSQDMDAPTTRHWINSKPQSSVMITHGVFHFYEDCESEFECELAPVVSMDSVTYGDLVGDGGEEAIVWLNYSTGGTANWDYLYVYRLKNGQPVLLARMRSGSRAYGGLVKVSVESGLLVIDFADQARSMGDCCSEGYIRVRYRWKTRKFVEVGPRERGDLKLGMAPS